MFCLTSPWMQSTANPLPFSDFDTLSTLRFVLQHERAFIALRSHKQKAPGFLRLGSFKLYWRMSGLLPASET
jgi:hypothetical protein